MWNFKLSLKIKDFQFHWYLKLFEDWFSYIYIIEQQVTKWSMIIYDQN